jgi:hypothetical protein
MCLPWIMTKDLEIYDYEAVALFDLFPPSEQVTLMVIFLRNRAAGKCNETRHATTTVCVHQSRSGYAYHSHRSADCHR